MSKKTADMTIKQAHDYLKEPYTRILIPESEGGFSAEILEFPGCYSYGDTPEEALKNLNDAAINWIEAAQEQGQFIPEPLDAGDASGRIALRLPRNLHRKAMQMAQRDRVSLNTFLVEAIAARVGAEDLSAKIMSKIDNRLSGMYTASAGLPLAMWNRVLDLYLDKLESPETTGKSTLFLHAPLLGWEATK
jgi:predicted RNase H-like HicB family nuclease